MLRKKPHRAGKSSSAHSGEGSVDHTIYRALMNGALHMIPFVILGGLLTALSLALGESPQKTAMMSGGLPKRDENPPGINIFSP